MDISTSYYYQYANQDLGWLPMDTESLYQHHLKTRHNELMQYNWIDTHFSYKFNSHGFRCNEFNTEPSVVFLGCSLTLGIGLPVESTWAQLLANELGLQCFNLAVGGASNDTAFRLAHAWLKQLRPQLVVVGTTFAERLELLADQDIVHLSPYSIEPKDFYRDWISCNTNGQLNKIKNTLAVNMLCDQLNIQFIAVDATQMLNKPVDLARDLTHPGVNTNQLFAQTVLSKV